MSRSCVVSRLCKSSRSGPVTKEALDVAADALLLLRGISGGYSKGRERLKAFA